MTAAGETYRLDHVAIGLPRLAEAMPFVVGTLGGRPWIGGPNRGFRGGEWRFANGALLELLEPAGPPGGFLHRFLAARGPGIHHVTFKVPSLAAAIDRSRAHGFEVVGVFDALPAWKEAFLHPKQAQGIVVQLVEAQPSLGDEWTTRWEPPPAPPAPREPAWLVAVRIAAPARADAERLWVDCLQGRAHERDGVLELRWPDSPLRLRVAVEADADPGPRWIEVAAARPLALPEGPHPVLGARFVAVPVPDEAEEAVR